MTLSVKYEPTTGEQNKQFVGIKISNNEIQFHYPESYVLSPENDKIARRKDILAILKTIELAKTKTSDFSSYNIEHNSEHAFPIYSYLWVINDYLMYGRYENKEKKYVQGIQGKVNWKKTMRSMPIISNGNIIYDKIISEKRDQKDNILTEIYNCCVKKSMDNIGWIYGLSYDSEGVDYDRLYKKNYKYYLSIIDNEIAHTFNDNKKTRLQNMKNIFIGLDDESVKTRDIIYGVDSYDYVYERMIDNMFSNIDDIKKFYPNGTIDLVLESGPKNSSNLRPDTIIIDVQNKKAYVIDAKNYRYGQTFNPKDVPDTTSIQKQVTYGEYIKMLESKKNKKDFNEIYSAFIMPYSKIENKYKSRFNKNIEFVGISETKWYENSKSSNRMIADLLIDMNYLVNNWNSDDNEAITKELIEQIENVDKWKRHE